MKSNNSGLAIRLALTLLTFSLSWLSLLGETSARTPAQENGKITSPFGIGGDYHTNQSAHNNAKWIPQMALIGIKSLRTCNTGWEAIEPEEGKWTWGNLDAQMNYLAENGIQFGGIFAGCAPWNKHDQPGTLPVNNLSGWSSYVSEVVRHTRGKIKYWEVWNEPPNGTGQNQTPADYAKIVVASYDAAKAADPDCLVGLATKSVDLSYLSQAIKSGAKDHFDYITLHPYEVLGGVVDNKGTEPIFMNIVHTVRKMLADTDSQRANVPIIFTEIGCDAGKGLDVQASAVVKTYAMSIAQGVTCINWFEGIDGDSGPMGLLQADGTQRPAYKAMAQLIKSLGSTPTYLGWLLFNDKDYGFVFQGASGPVLITWLPKGLSDDVNFGRSVTITDPLTGSTTNVNTYALTTTPIIVSDVPANLMTIARTNKAKPLVWDGDYTDAKSVSINMGATNIEKGLHTQAGANIAADVVAYGGSARAGNIPGGNVFMVDPNFLSYTSTPIEIAIVVRRNEANDNAGFKLTYESTTGFKNCGWYAVPDNKQWHTVKWKITDAEFVNMWNFNFALDSDGNQFNKYDIQSVTVTKLTD